MSARAQEDHHAPADTDGVELLRRVGEACPDVPWVGLQTPKQDGLARERKDRLRVPVAAGVGAAFGFMSGRISRAPQWIGRRGMEWAWRVVHEPRKLWRRVLLDGPRFATHACLELAGLRRYE